MKKNKLSKIEKKIKIFELYLKLEYDHFVNLFFDFDSYKMLDEKIEVFEQLLKGKEYYEIKNYYKILENAPKGFPSAEYFDEETGKTIITFW